MCPQREFALLLAIVLCLGPGEGTFVVFPGDTAELPCDNDGAVISIKWKKGADPTSAETVASFEGGSYVGSDDGRITMSHDRSLMIGGVVAGDEGTYHCVAQMTSQTEEVHSTQLLVAVPPQDPYPTLVLVDPPADPPTNQNASCQYIVQATVAVRVRCEANGFRPTIRLDWRKNSTAVSGPREVYLNGSDGTLTAYSYLDFTMGGTAVVVSCVASGESVPDEPHTAMATICSTGPVGGGTNVITIIVIVIIVLVLVAALVGLAIWIRRLVKDTMVRSSYTKTVSADDDTPSRSRMSNYCYFCRLTCCPCVMREELYDAETSKKASRSKNQADKKHKAPSAALKARIQQNRRKQEGKAGPDGERQHPSGPGEHAPMLDDTPVASNQAAAAPVNNKPPGARPKTRPSEDAVIIRDPSQAAQARSSSEGEGPARGEAETGF